MGSIEVDGYRATSPTLRGPAVDPVVGVIAAIEEVRQFVRHVEREWAAGRSIVVVEGRDTGTVLFPTAEPRCACTPRSRSGRDVEPVTPTPISKA